METQTAKLCVCFIVYEKAYHMMKRHTHRRVLVKARTVHILPGICACVHIYIHMYMCVCIHIYVYVCAYKYIYMQVYIYTRVYI